MSAKNLNLVYFCSAIRYKENEVSSHMNYVKDAEFSYAEIFTNSCMFSKMATKMAAEN